MRKPIEGVVEIYGLFDSTGELRYVGKAKSAQARFKRHLAESRNLERPVNRWVRKLLAAGDRPRMQVLDTVPESEWQSAEIRWIAFCRQTCDLLNLADGGDRPSQTAEQRKSAARAASKSRDADPRWKALWKAKRDYARCASQTQRDGDMLSYWAMRIHMHRRAERRPDLFGDWYLRWYAERLAA
jgi:hypothetical protein